MFEVYIAIFAVCCLVSLIGWIPYLVRVFWAYSYKLSRTEAFYVYSHKRKGNHYVLSLRGCNSDLDKEVIVPVDEHGAFNNGSIYMRYDIYTSKRYKTEYFTPVGTPLSLPCKPTVYNKLFMIIPILCSLICGVYGIVQSRTTVSTSNYGLMLSVVSIVVSLVILYYSIPNNYRHAFKIYKASKNPSKVGTYNFYVTSKLVKSKGYSKSSIQVVEPHMFDDFVKANKSTENGDSKFYYYLVVSSYDKKYSKTIKVPYSDFEKFNLNDYYGVFDVYNSDMYKKWYGVEEQYKEYNNSDEFSVIGTICIIFGLLLFSLVGAIFDTLR